MKVRGFLGKKHKRFIQTVGLSGENAFLIWFDKAERPGIWQSLASTAFLCCPSKDGFTCLDVHLWKTSHVPIFSHCCSPGRVFIQSVVGLWKFSQERWGRRWIMETLHLLSFSNPLAYVCLLPCILHYTTNLSAYTTLHNKSFCVYYTSPQICPCKLHCATKPSLHTAYFKKHVSKDMQYKICLVDRNKEN